MDDPNSTSRAMNLDRVVAAVMAGVYGVSVVTCLPASTYVHMLAGGALYFAAVAALAYGLGPRATPAMSIMLVAVAGIAGLLVPNFPAMGGRHIVGVPIGFVGSQAGALIWVSLRWKPDPGLKGRITMFEALVGALFGAIALSVIASIPIALAVLSGGAEARGLLWVYPAYFAGVFGAAVLYWILQGIAHRPVGRYLIGALGGFCMYAAMGPVMSVTGEEPLDLQDTAMIGIVLGCLVGPSVVMGWNDDGTSLV